MVFQHRLVMECRLGRFLSARERVHHLNHDAADNRPENLELATSHEEHMRQHWRDKGRRDPLLIERVRLAAKNPNHNLASLGMSATTARLICQENGIEWIRGGQWLHVHGLTEARVREALRGRTTQEAARILGASAATLYNRFGHLLTKRTSPGSLDVHRAEILDLVYRDRVPRAQIATRFGVTRQTVTKSIQRWLGPDAMPGAPGAPPRGRQRGYGPRRKARDKASRSPERP